jgi:hypothetical protein
MELAYRLAVDESPYIKSIRDGMVTLITPVVRSRRSQSHGRCLQLAFGASRTELAATGFTGDTMSRMTTIAMRWAWSLET